MKIDRHGQAKILTPKEIQLLFTQGFTNERDRALFGICLYGACRIREACSLRTEDVYNRKVYDLLATESCAHPQSNPRQSSKKASTKAISSMRP